MLLIILQLFLLQGFFQLSDEACPIPSFFHGDYYSLERGVSVHTIITGPKLESSISTDECSDLEQIEGTERDGIYDARVVTYSRLSACYTCYELYVRTPNILQVKKSSCQSNSNGEINEVCSFITPQTQVVTMFAKLYAQVNCNETLAGPTYQFSYEMDMGGGGICDNRNSIIKACQSPGSPYLDNQVFTMMFASCPDIPASVDTDIRFQCLGSWREGGLTFSAVADLGDDIFRSRFRCLVTSDAKSETRQKRFTMSHFADCSTLKSEYEGPIRLILKGISAAQDDPCNFHLDIEGASKDINVQDSISYNCQDGMYFEDGNMTKQTPCTCDSIDEVLSWGTCTVPPPVTRKPDEAGPRIVQNPETVYYNAGDLVGPHFQCVASGYPRPTYKWLSYESMESKWTELDPDKEINFKVDEGILTILEPAEVIQESRQFVCLAENKYGTVRSETASAVLAFINDFPRSQRDPIYATEWQGAVIECNPPSYGGYEGLQYWWYKDNIIATLRPDRTPHIFISQNGKLYFSRVLSDDIGDYHCVVYGKGSTVPKTSMPIMLQVINAAESNTPVEIVSGFPVAFPSAPLLNENVTLECVAFGASSLNYTWEKEDDLMPANIVFANWNRTLTIISIQLENAGIYKCIVTDGVQSSSNSVSVDIAGSAPYFVEHLEDYYSKGPDVILRASAEGDPAASYVWYRNGMEITDNDITPGTSFSIMDNELIIKTNDISSHTGMYQVAATNVHGTVYTTAQVWELDPTSGPISKAQSSRPNSLFFGVISSLALFFVLSVVA